MRRRPVFPVVAFLALAAGCSGGNGGGNDIPDPETCPGRRVACGEICVDLRTDPSNCGACGRACVPGDVCGGGTCARPCDFHRFVVGEIVEVGRASSGVAAADANGDGLAELVVVDPYAHVWVIPQTSPGFFGEPFEIAEGNFPATVVAADLDEDGRADLILGEQQEDRVLSLRSTGDGTFAKRWVERIAAHPTAYAVGDLDADGHLDLVATAPRENVVVLLRGDGTGEFREVYREKVSGRPFLPALGDFDGDGETSVVFAMEDSTILVFLHRRDGEYRLEQVDALDRVVGLAAGDFDGDGLDDLAVSGARELAVLLGRATGPFERLAPVGVGGTRIAAGDVDGDGRAEVVSLGRGKLQVLEVAGAAVQLASESDVGAGFTLPALVDLDGDRVLDLVGLWPGVPESETPGRAMAAFSHCD